MILFLDRISLFCRRIKRRLARFILVNPMRNFSFFLILALGWPWLFRSLQAADELALGVRTTEPVAAEKQRDRFHLPPGFEIQLVAAEPQINKPMNLAFDAIGRLWVTTSIEYPWAAPADRPSLDRLMIFEDFGPDGRARKTTEFAGGLNIPIGVYPFRTDDQHWKAIVWSIPNIWLLEDTDGDGKADQRTVLYGPFDHTRDTHGNQASFRRGFDGWMYASHGFNNDSHVTALDGSRVDLNSGNTYRVRLDRSRIEHHTHGQVNPFGLTWDSRGNLYSSDCHSAPIYQLLAGGYYPSFGKPHDGLGFAPVMLEHAHGSTAIDGALYYEDALWPSEYKDMFLIGNVMTSRLNRDRIEFVGSTPKAIEQPDFLTSDDSWFRPVDTLLGPDGALYVADFYNRIIGHYEVPLTHPGRDRDKGRLWRIVYTGKDGRPVLRSPALAVGLEGLLGELDSPNLGRRLLAQHEINDRYGRSAVLALREKSRTSEGSGEADNRVRARVHALWALENLGALTEAELIETWNAPEPVVRIHGLRMAVERRVRRDKNGALTFPLERPEVARAILLRRISDPDALVRRCAVEVLGAWPTVEAVRPLMALLTSTEAQDTHLQYVVRKALRDHLAVPALFESVLGWAQLNLSESRLLSGIALSVNSPEAARFLIRELPQLSGTTLPSLGDALKHSARYASEAVLPDLVTIIRGRFAGEVDFQLGLFRSMEQGLGQRGSGLSPSLKEWGLDLAERLLSESTESGWSHQSKEGSTTESPWDFQVRNRADGSTLRVLSSLMRGEQKTGTVRSPEFIAGSSLTFWLCGHDGYPDKPAKKVNAVRLRDAIQGTLLFEVRPPRSDIALRVQWKTDPFLGRRVILEVVDGDDGDAYAWIAIGGIEGGPALPASSPRARAERMVAAAGLAARTGQTGLIPRLKVMALSAENTEVRAAAARGWMQMDPSDAVVGLGPLVVDPLQSINLRERMGLILSEGPLPTGHALVTDAFKGMPYRVQQVWATALVGHVEGASLVLKAVELGVASPRLLQVPSLRDRIQRAVPANGQVRMEKLTRGLSSFDEVRDRFITTRRVGYTQSATRADLGQKVFETHCAPCHQIEGKGGLVGPQLTGIGNRGVERLCEDILDPNRTVDPAFRQTLVTLNDGETVSGLFRREEGEVLVLANGLGVEFTVPKSSVLQREEGALSLMPDNFGESITEPEFQHLLNYLLTRR